LITTLFLGGAASSLGGTILSVRSVVLLIVFAD
jgi:hypothetical protein